MKELIKSVYTKIINFVLESFGFPGINDYIQLNSSEVRKNLHKKMYYLNLRRILSIMPLMLIINIFTIIYYVTTNQHPEIT